ncbi:TnpA8 protein (plasmid) [Mesorhizobium loti]|nr:TnpA8 protein [Mesorhizobium loti]
MFADDQAFRSDNDTLRIDPQAHWPISKGCWNAVAVALQVHEAGRGNPLGIFDNAVERTGVGMRACTSSAQISAMVPRI